MQYVYCTLYTCVCIYIYYNSLPAVPRSDWTSTSGSWWGTTCPTSIALRWSSRSSSSFLCLDVQ